MRQGRLKIDFGPTLFFHHAGKAVKSGKPVNLFCVTNFGLLQRPPQYRERFIIGLQRDREGMSVFTAVRK